MATEATTPTAVTMAQSEADRAANEKRIWETAADSAKKKAARRAGAKSPATLRKNLATAKTSKKSPKVDAKKTSRDMADAPASDRRLALVKLLRKMGATSASTSRPIDALANKLGYNQYDVYCLGYHKFHLAKQGMIKTVKMEDQKVVSYYLTAKGAKASDEDIRG